MLIKNLFVLMTFVLFSTTAVSQTATENLVLEEVLVSAQKREQNLQEVPISIVAFRGEMLQDGNMLNFDDLARQVPNFEVAEFESQTLIAIRGVSSQYNSGIEQAVGLFIDGVHQSRDRLYRSPFLDVGRVEVLRGPQGTLFGKNTTAGAVQIFTNRPTRDFEASLAGTYTFDTGDNYGGYNLEGVISGPLSDTFSARFAGRRYDSDGYFYNAYLDETEPQKEISTARLSLMWEPSEDVTAVLKYETSDTDTRGMAIRTDDALEAISLLTGATYADHIAQYEWVQQTEVPFAEGDWLRAVNPMRDQTKTDALTLTVEAKFGDFDFVSISGYSEYDVDFRRDTDQIPLEFLSQDFDQEYEGFSQEFRLLSPSNDTFEYIVGAYYQKTDFRDDQLLNLDGDVLITGGAGQSLPPFSMATLYDSDSESWSAFGQGTWYATDKLSFVLGLRYGKEKKSAVRTLRANYFETENPVSPEEDPVLFFTAQGLMEAFGFLVPHTVTGDRSVNDFSPSFKVQYGLGENTMIYGSVAKALKSGGFDSQSGYPDDFEFDDEDTISYEIGTKGTYLDGRLRANVAVFLMDVTDEQLSQFTGVTTVIGNIGEAEYRGVEFDLSTYLTESLSLDFGTAYLKGDRTKADFNPELEGNMGLPKWSVNANINHHVDIGSELSLHSMLRLEYVDSRTNLELKGRQLPSYAMWDARVALAARSGLWEVALLGQNLTDEVITTGGTGITATSDEIGFQRFLRQPRTFSLQFRLNF